MFFARINELADADTIKKKIERAEKTLEFKKMAPQLIERKVVAYENPYEEMQIYTTQKSKYFTRESDVVILCLTHKHGYGNWSDIKRALRYESRCRFDHFLLSRNEQELQKRVDLLVKGLEKESAIAEAKRKVQGPEEDEEEMIDLEALEK